jgi:hypothetical protein
VGRKIYYIGGQTSPDVPRLNEIWAYDVGSNSLFPPNQQQQARAKRE